MGSALHLLLAFFALASFFSMIFFFPDDSSRNYIKFVLLFYPLLAIDLTPGYVSMNIFVFTTVIFILFFYRKRNIFSSGVGIYAVLFAIFLLVLFLGLLFADDLGRDSITSSMEFIAIFVFSKVLIEESIHDTAFITQVKKYLKVTIFLALVFLVLQIYFGPSFTIAKSQNANVISGVKIRYTSFFQDPQKFAQFLSACSFMFLFPTAKGRRNAQLGIVLFLVTVTAIFFTGGRSALGGWLLAMIGLVVFSNARFRVAFIVIFGLLLSVAYFYAESFALFQRESTVADAYAFRYEIWKDAFGIFSDHAFWGIGSGNYANYVSLHHPDQYWIADNEVTYFDHPESGYLKLLVEYGITGFMVFCLFVLIPAFSAIRLYLKTRNIHYILPLASIVSWMVGFYTVYSLGDIRIFILVATLVSLLIVDHETCTETTSIKEPTQTA